MARILLLEDDEPLNRLFAEVLEEEGHTVTARRDGAASADPALVGATDLVVTDIMMDGCDGFEVLRNLRRNAPDLPVVAISGGGSYLDLDFLPVAQSLGARAVLTKPFDADSLIGTVSALLPGAEPQAAPVAAHPPARAASAG